MANDSLHASANTAREAAAVIQWHPGFCSAVEFELRKNKDALSFHRDYTLSKGQLQADLLVIELLEHVAIENEIGKIFRKHNLFEFKSPKDGMSIDDVSIQSPRCFAEFRAAARNKIQSIFDGNRVFGENSFRGAECTTNGSARSVAHPSCSAAQRSGC